MLFLQSGAWAANPSVRMVWRVQALVDKCTEWDDSGNCTDYEYLNRAQVIATYEDDWYLTGLNVGINTNFAPLVPLGDNSIGDFFARFNAQKAADDRADRSTLNTIFDPADLVDRLLPKGDGGSR